jgi:hypothetical protein
VLVNGCAITNHYANWFYDYCSKIIIIIIIIITTTTTTTASTQQSQVQ